MQGVDLSREFRNRLGIDELAEDNTARLVGSTRLTPVLSRSDGIERIYKMINRYDEIKRLIKKTEDLKSQKNMIGMMRSVRDLLIAVKAAEAEQRADAEGFKRMEPTDSEDTVLMFELKVSFLEGTLDGLSWKEVKGEVASYCARVDKAEKPGECRKLLNLFYSQCISKATFDIEIPGYGKVSLCCTGTLKDEAGSCIGETASQASRRGEDWRAATRKITKRLILALANLPEIAVNGARSSFINSYCDREKAEGISYAYAKGQVLDGEQFAFSAVLTVKRTRNAVMPYHLNPEGSEQYKHKLQYLVKQIQVDGDDVTIRGQMGSDVVAELSSKS